VFTITLKVADVNAVKSNLANLGSTEANTWLIMTANVIKDMAAVDAVNIVDGNAKQAAKVTGDTEAPVLQAF
jgi:hypothetical protein